MEPPELPVEAVDLLESAPKVNWDDPAEDCSCLPSVFLSPKEKEPLPDDDELPDDETLLEDEPPNENPPLPPAEEPVDP